MNASSPKKIIKNIFKFFGLNLSKITITQPNPLTAHNIELLLDVGANTGQYAIAARTNGYKGRIVSFEPLPEAHTLLEKNTKNDPLWTAHKRCALGSKFGEVEINISKNSYSSSLMPMLDTHSSAAPESIYIGKARTEVISLDSVFDYYRQNNEITFLKIDTQGFEREVLKGLEINLKNIFAIQLELSIVPLYENQDLYEYFFDFFKTNGFHLWNLIPGFFNPQSGQLLQFDAVFVKNN